MYPNLTENQVKWLASGKRGVSSNTIFSWLTGIDAYSYGYSDHPHDPDDVCRCVRLLEACPELAPRLEELGDVSDEWAVLVEHWGEIVALIEEEAPGWRVSRQGFCPKAFILMRALLDAVEHNGEEA